MATMQTDNMCTVAEDVAGKLKKLRFNKSKTKTAIILKIDVKKDEIIIDEELEDCCTEDIQEELPDMQPRYIAYSYVYTTSDDRKTYPLIFVYYKPRGCKPEQSMRYAGCNTLILKIFGQNTSHELTDKEELTDEWIINKLGRK